MLSLASPAFISIYHWHVVEGTLRILVNNQRKISQAFLSPFPLFNHTVSNELYFSYLSFPLFMPITELLTILAQTMPLK